MDEYNTQESFVYQNEQIGGFSKYLGKVCLWMFVGLIITFGVSLGLSSLMSASEILETTWFLLLAAPIAQIIICIAMGKNVYKQKSTTVTVLYFIYAALSGVTFGFIFSLIDIATISYALGLTSVLFLVMAVLGLTSHINLEKFTNLIFIGLICLIVLSIFSFFIFSTTLERVISILGIFLITFLTMIDFQRLKKIYYAAGSENKSLTIYGAFNLYLDFISMFLYILRLILANRK
jgi:FtsH-binding integral membrane protein